MDKLLTELEMLISVLSKNILAEKKTNTGAVPVFTNQVNCSGVRCFPTGFFAAFLFH